MSLSATLRTSLVREHTCELLTELNRYGNRHPKPIRRQKKLLPRQTLALLNLKRYTVKNLLKLGSYFRCIVASADPDQRVECLFVSAFLGKPSNRLFDQQLAKTHKGARHELEADWNLPLR